MSNEHWERVKRKVYGMLQSDDFTVDTEYDLHIESQKPY